MPTRFLILVLSIGLMTAVTVACEQPAEDGHDKYNSLLLGDAKKLSIDDLVDLELDVPGDVPHNQQAGILLRVRHVDPDAYLSLSNARPSLRVLQEDGTEIYQSGDNYTETARYNTIAPGETAEYRMSWPHLFREQCVSLDTGLGCPAPPGRYQIQASLLVGFVQVLQAGETLGVAEQSEVKADPTWLTVTGEAGDPNVSPFWDPVNLEDPILTHPARRLSGGTQAPEQVSLGETAIFKIIVGNGFDEPLEVPLRQPMYDFTVSTLDSTEVWRWSDTQETDDTPVAFRLEPGQWEEFEVEWDLRGRNGDPVPAGLYEVEGWLRLAPEGEISLTRQFMFVGSKPSLRDVMEVELLAPKSTAAREDVRMRVIIKNVSGSILRLWYGADYVVFQVRDGSDNTIGPEAGAYLLWLGGMQLFPGQVRVVEQIRSLERDLEGFPLEPGEYQIKGIVKFSLQDPPHGSRSYERLETSVHTLTITEAPLPEYAKAIELELTAPSEVRAGESVPMDMRITNTSDKPVILWWSSDKVGPRPNDIEIVVFRDGEPVWRATSAHGVQYQGTITLGPGESQTMSGMSFRATNGRYKSSGDPWEWDQRADCGEPVEPGTYTVRGVVNVSPPETMEQEPPFTAERTTIATEPRELVIIP
ncbi:MAG: BsuPI-related putative proteinase inhibitor [Chloroflexi bacterium]|nr:BsuPI-related putative proteinase inhibitor [Chloroflexota bacterium]